MIVTLKDMSKELGKAIKSGSSVILDNYSMKDGLYIRLNIDEEVINIEDDDVLVVNSKEKDEVVKNIDLCNWIKERDYLSRLPNDDTNKVVGGIKTGRKIHSTNYLTLFVKKDVCPGLGGEKEISAEDLNKYLEAYYNEMANSEKKLADMCNGKKESNGGTLEKFFPHLAEQLGEKRKEQLQRVKQFMLNNLNDLLAVLKRLSEGKSFGGYVKMFIDEDISTYQLESELYVIPKIFNVNDYNIPVDGQVYGLPSENMTTNTKKPYLLLKTMKCTVPSRVTVNEAKISRALFEWLAGQGKNKHIKFEQGYSFNGGMMDSNKEGFFSLHLNKDGEIDEYDYIPNAVKDIEFKFENVLGIRNKDGQKVYYDEITKPYVLEWQVCRLLFNNEKLAEGYLKSKEPDIKTNKFTAVMKTMFIGSRDAMFDCFSKGVNHSFKKMTDKLSMDLVEEQMKHTIEGTNMSRLRTAYNLRISLLEYFEVGGGNELADKLKNIISTTESKLSSQEKSMTIENDEEFYFICGQMAYYMLYQTESKSKSFGLFEPILVCRNSDQLKRKLNETFNTYKHALSFTYEKFKRAFAAVMAYDAEVKIEGTMKDMLMAGIMADNIFLKKKEEQKDVDEK